MVWENANYDMSNNARRRYPGRRSFYLGPDIPGSAFILSGQFDFSVGDYFLPGFGRDGPWPNHPTAYGLYSSVTQSQ